MVPVAAEMEFPPTFHSPQAKIEYVTQLIEQIPQVGTQLNHAGALAVVNGEELLVHSLINDPDFLKAAKEHPPLQVFSFQRVNPRTEEIIEEHILREIPPRLAIFRGCVGGDCSTSHSWAYPYSPFERYFFIESREGKIIGYVSGAITKVNGQPNFYLRDVVGPGLKPEQIPTIVYGFYLALEKMGLNQMTLMPLEFAHENVYQPQEDILKAIPTAVIVNQVFQDQDFRIKYLDRSVTNREFDAVTRHAAVRQMNPENAVLQNYRIKLLGDELTSKNIGVEPTSRYWELIDGATASNDVVILSRNVDPHRDWQSFLNVLRNEQKLPLQEFYESAMTASEANGFPLSQNLIRKHDVMFRVGHLNAPDAFTTTDPKLLRQTVRYVRSLLWNQSTASLALEIIQEHRELMESHEVMIDAFASLFERHRDQDAILLAQLWGIGIHLKNLRLTELQVDWAIASARSADVLLAMAKKRKEFSDHLPTPVVQRLAKLLDSGRDGDESVSEAAAALLYDADLSDPEVLNEVVESIEQDENAKIFIPLSIAYLRSTVKTAAVARVAVEILAANIQTAEFPTEWRQEAKRLLATPEVKHLLAHEGENCETILTKDRRRTLR
jgi:hypothetical protein